MISFMTDKEILQKAIAQALRKERKRQGLKFTIFSYENDIPTTTLYMLENGNSNTRAVNMFHVAEALGLSCKDFGELIDKEIAILKSEQNL